MSKVSADFMQQVAKETFDAVIKKTVEGFFADRWGYGSQEDVMVAIKEAVFDMVRTDPEIRDRIKKRLIAVIDKGDTNYA